MLRVGNLGNSCFGPVSFDVAAGECIAIRGASGAGKSVLLRAIADLDPSEGDVDWLNHRRAETPAPDWRRLISYVPAETGWWADTVAAHFATDIDLRPHFEALGLPADAINWDVARLSTGERHRLGLLRAFLRSPSVLLLDEPTASLDATATEQVETLMRGALDRGVAIVLVTHDPAQAARLAARSFVITAGALSELDVTEPTPQ